MIAPHRVAITGLGILAANGNGKDAFWRTLEAGESGIGPITLFDASDLPCRIAGEVKNFNSDDWIDPKLKSRRRMGRFTQLGLAAARMATEDAGLSIETLREVPYLPVVMGVSTAAMDLRSQRASVFSAVAGVPHAATSAIGYTYNATPRLLTLSDGCASSLDAVAMAARMIRYGESEVVITGGAEGSVDHYIVEAMLKCRRCSTQNDAPEKASRPFDRNRDYGVLAEGAAVVVLENMAHATSRGAHVYAEIVGYGSCADRVDSADGAGLAQSMMLAMTNAGIRGEQVDYIGAHGPSDIDMDRVETEAIKAAFGERAYLIPVSSVKGAVGCPMGAAGAIQLVASALAMKHQVLPPTANYEFPDPVCDLDYVPRARASALQHILVNTHGFGRGNGSMLIREAGAS
jgi:3-oxoacyl-[acyl-carrier-protein] synthase II